MMSESSSKRLRGRQYSLSPLALKILLPVVLAMLSTCFVLFAVYSQRTRVQGMDDLHNQLATFTASKAAELTEPVWNFQDDLVQRLMKSYEDNRDLFRASLYDRDGKLIALANGPDGPPHSTLLRDERDLTRRVGGDMLTIGKLVVEYHDGHLMSVLRQRRQSDSMMALCLVLVLSGTTWILFHFLIGKPIIRIQTSLRKNATRSEREPLVWKSNDELGDVVTAYNELLYEVRQQTERLVNINSTLQQEIAQRKEAEARLAKAHDQLERKVKERTRELELANRRLVELDMQRSAFLSSASHELRTPLAAILGFSVLIKKNFSNAFMPHADAHGLRDKGELILANLDIVGKEGDRLTRLIEDLLDLNKIEAGRMEWRDALLDVKEEIHRSLKTMESTFDTLEDVALKVEISPELPGLYCDPDRFQQLLLNLLSNAAKHTSKGEIGIEASARKGMIVIAVSDTGAGIPRDDRDAIFDKFYQAGGSDTHKPSGTGLGLPICRNIVEHYGGNIRVESQPGGGSRFIVNFPTSRKS